MIFHNIEILQDGNKYGLFLLNGNQVGLVCMPPDGNFVADGEKLNDITQAIDNRWHQSGRMLIRNRRIVKPVQRMCNNIMVVQYDFDYRLYLFRKMRIGQFFMPPDGTYVADMQAIDKITAGLAARWKRNVTRKRSK